MNASIHSKTWDNPNQTATIEMPPDGVEYTQINHPEEMKKLAEEMIAFAKENLFDYQAAIKEAKESGKNSEIVNGFLRVKGEDSLESCQKYTRLIQMGKYYFQICCLEMDIEDMGRIRQFTLVENFQKKLEIGVSGAIMYFFFDMNRIEDIKFTETPRHVLLAVQKVVNE